MVCSLFSKQRPSRSLTWLVGVMAIAALMVGLLLSVASCGGQQTATTNAPLTTEVASIDTTIENTTTSAAAGAIDAALIGKWHSAQTSETLEFTSDGKMIITSDDTSLGANEFTYRVEGANVVYGLAGAALFTSPYSIDGDVLTIVNPDVGGPVTCNRVK